MDSVPSTAEGNRQKIKKGRKEKKGKGMEGKRGRGEGRQRGGEGRKENDLFPQGRDGERPEEVDRPMRSRRRSSGNGETFYSAVPTFRPGAVP